MTPDPVKPPDRAKLEESIAHLARRLRAVEGELANERLARINDKPREDLLAVERERADAATRRAEMMQTDIADHMRVCQRELQRACEIEQAARALLDAFQDGQEPYLYHADDEVNALRALLARDESGGEAK